MSAMRHHLSETTASQRLIYGLVAGVAAAALPLPLDWPVRGLLGWCCGVALYLMLSWWLCLKFDARRTRERVQAQDEPNMVLFFVLFLATVVCLAAITILMQQSQALSGMARMVQIGLSVIAMMVSWLFIQTIFAFHYAHRYYQHDKANDAEGPSLTFPGDVEPDYFDFMYYSYVVGMTSQVSDVQVTSREMRRLTLVHGVLSFAFNLLIVALSINVVAGMLQ